MQKYKVNRKSPNLFTKNVGKSPNLFTKNVGKSPNLCCKTLLEYIIYRNVTLRYDIEQLTIFIANTYMSISDIYHLPKCLECVLPARMRDNGAAAYRHHSDTIYRHCSCCIILSRLISYDFAQLTNTTNKD